MFGYIITNAETLPKERQERFRNFYCGLCRELKTRYGDIGRLTLSHDMAFLSLLLAACCLFASAGYNGSEEATRGLASGIHYMVSLDDDTAGGKRTLNEMIDMRVLSTGRHRLTLSASNAAGAKKTLYQADFTIQDSKNS